MPKETPKIIKTGKPFFWRLNLHTVQKFLSKLDKQIRQRCIKEIFKLAVQPIPKVGEHVLDAKDHRLLCELPVDKIRFYYEISQGK